MRGCRAGRGGRSRTPRRVSTRDAIPTHPSLRAHPEHGLPAPRTVPTLSASLLPAAGSGAKERRGQVRASMADSTPRPADFRVDHLSVVRAWLWRHSSQPNGDPWDGDPEHLDWAARRLLDELAERLPATGSPASAAEQDLGCTRDRRDVASPAAALRLSYRHPERAR